MLRNMPPTRHLHRSPPQYKQICFVWGLGAVVQCPRRQRIDKQRDSLYGRWIGQIGRTDESSKETKTETQSRSVAIAYGDRDRGGVI